MVSAAGLCQGKRVFYAARFYDKLRTMKRGWYTVVIVFLTFFLRVPSLYADIFRWVDDQGVVHFTDNLENIPEKYRSKVTRIKTESPQTPIPASPDKASVPFQKRGELMIIQATFNERAAANLVVDTGATYTVISQATAKELEIDLEKSHPSLSFQTANGVIQAPLVSVPSIEIGGLRLKDFMVAVHDVFPDATISGLLGLNFLSQFRLAIDNQNGILLLEKK
jgi:clan AA aspartic protease (TIGR02281 family)